MIKLTNELIKIKNEIWFKETETESNIKYYGSEMILNKIFAHTKNDNLREVHTKCYYLNKFYSTRMSNDDIKQIAKHIVSVSNFDDILDKGSIQAIDEIAFNSGTKKKNFSFATKYCSFSNPTKYPIYDTRVEEALWQYQKEGIISSYKRDEIRENLEGVNRYGFFREKITELIKTNKLKCSYKELDHFLWLK